MGLQGRISVRTNIVRVSTHSPLPRPVRVAFASDFHAGATTHPQMLVDACRALAALEPDVLLLGGDFVSVRAQYMAELTAALTLVAAPHGCFAVLGNHDLRANAAQVAAGLSAGGIELLVNRHVALTIDGCVLSICGLDDPIRGQPRADVAMNGAPGIRIVLMHSPDGLLSIGARAFAVAVCGHTHGGQVALPNGTPLLLPKGRLSRRYPSGRFDLADGEGGGIRTLIVSRGVGCSTLPIRLFAPPEVHLISLE